MAAEIKSALGIDAELVKLSGGVFEVYSNGRKVFSKLALGRFPDEGEILKSLRAAKA